MFSLNCCDCILPELLSRLVVPLFQDDPKSDYNKLQKLQNFAAVDSNVLDIVVDTSLMPKSVV